MIKLTKEQNGHIERIKKDIESWVTMPLEAYEEKEEILQTPMTMVAMIVFLIECIEGKPDLGNKMSEETYYKSGKFTGDPDKDFYSVDHINKICEKMGYKPNPKNG